MYISRDQLFWWNSSWAGGWTKQSQPDVSGQERGFDSKGGLRAMHGEQHKESSSGRGSGCRRSEEDDEEVADTLVRVDLNRACRDQSRDTVGRADQSRVEEVALGFSSGCWLPCCVGAAGAKEAAPGRCAGATHCTSPTPGKPHSPISFLSLNPLLLLVPCSRYHASHACSYDVSDDLTCLSLTSRDIPLQLWTLKQCV